MEHGSEYRQKYLKRFGLLILLLILYLIFIFMYIDTGSVPFIGNVTRDHAFKSFAPPPLFVKMIKLVKRKNYICHEWMGRLGNQMHQYAAIFGISKEYSMTFLIKRNNLLRKSFKITAPVMKDKTIERTCKHAALVPIKNGVFSLPANKNVTLNGYFGSQKYYEKYVDDVRKEFEFLPAVKTKGRAMLNKMLRSHDRGFNNVTLVGVHIRRGDYIKEKRYLASKLYLSKARIFFREKFPNPLFLVATNVDKDSIQWCSKNFVVNNSDTLLLEKADAGIHMLILSQCHHNIITSGTYGYWAAWLSNGTTIYPVPDLSLIRKRIPHFTFHFPFPNWIGIKDNVTPITL